MDGGCTGWVLVVGWSRGLFGVLGEIYTVQARSKEMATGLPTLPKAGGLLRRSGLLGFLPCEFRGPIDRLVAKVASSRNLCCEFD